MTHILLVLQTEDNTVFLGIFPEYRLIYQVGYLLVLVSWNAVDILAYGLGEVLAVVLALYCGRKIVAVPPVDILGTTSGTSIDCGDDNIKYACAELLGSLTFSEKHSDIKESPERKYSQLTGKLRDINVPIKM